MNMEQIKQEALTRATTNETMSNYPAIFEGFMEKGIPEDDILPRENIFTYRAWQAKGRQVQKGEHGVKIVTWIDVKSKKKDEGDDEKVRKMPRTVTVFHVSQTKKMKDN